MQNFDPKDMPWQCRLNWLWRKTGWECWWRYQYVGNTLDLSETHWLRHPTSEEE